MIELIRISKRFGTHSVLSGISLKVNPGSVVAVVGPNGAGKTILLDIITGFVRPTEGVCRVANRDIVNLSVEEVARLRVGRTFQSVRLPFQQTVRETLQVAVSPPGVAWMPFSFGWRAGRVDQMDLVEQTAAQFGISDLMNLQSGRLSFGQRKLLAVACCAIRKPILVILDEPFSGVDSVGAEKIRDFLVRIRSQGGCGLVVEHNLMLFDSFIDERIILKEGKVRTEAGAR